MRFACVPVAILACACGRIGFGGAAQGDGGASDAPDDGALVDTVTDASMTYDAPPSVCSSAPVNMCDGFETGTLDPRWQTAGGTSMGTLTVDTSFFYRGGSSLHAHINPITSSTSNPRAEMRSYEGLPVPSSPIYVRVFAFIAGSNPNRFTQYVNLVDDSGQGASAGEENDDLVNNNYAIQPPDYLVSATPMPHDRWFCLSYQVPAATGTGQLRLFVDDVEITDIRATATNHPAPTHVYLGIDIPSTVTSQSAADAWFDEIMVDDTPISCTD